VRGTGRTRTDGLGPAPKPRWSRRTHYDHEACHAGGEEGEQQRRRHRVQRIRPGRQPHRRRPLLLLLLLLLLTGRHADSLLLPVGR
jgi:hypothetical protein